MPRLSGIAALVSAIAFVASTNIALANNPIPADQTVTQVNILSGDLGGGADAASAQNDAFQYASGNVGVNIASGNVNAQANTAFIEGTDVKYNDFTGANTQVIAGAASVFSGDNTATIQDSAFEHASGNIGLNVAAGGQNQQLNSLAVLENATSVDSSTAQAQAFTLSFDTESNTALIENSAFQYATGNIGVNLASGALNQQANSAVVTSDADLNSISTAIGQLQLGNLNIASNSNTARVQDTAFANATGNIGVNVAAGVGNQQANTLVVTP